MKTLNDSDFLRWANENGMCLDERYPHSAVLAFRPDPELARFWEVPPEPETRPYFIASMLELMGDWQSCFAWRHLGGWPKAAWVSQVNEAVEFRILEGLGLPLGTTDVVEIPKQESDKLVTLMFATTVFGWSVGEDLYVIPNHARHLLKTDHHDVIHADFRTQEDLDRFVAGMESRGYPLPDDLPDETFKRPSWMNRDDSG